MGSIFNFGLVICFCPRMAKRGVCWFIFIGCILLTKTLAYKGHRISRRFIAEYLF
jgi:hypothetical protein